MGRSKRNQAMEELLKQDASAVEEETPAEKPKPKLPPAPPPVEGKELTYKKRYTLGIENLKRSQQEKCLVYSLIDESDTRSHLVERAEQLGKEHGVRVCVWDKDDMDNTYKFEPPPKEGESPPAPPPKKGRGRK